jgi:hypothetical protein
VSVAEWFEIEQNLKTQLRLVVGPDNRLRFTRSIEERFLDSVARLVRTSEREEKAATLRSEWPFWAVWLSVGQDQMMVSYLVN